VRRALSLAVLAAALAVMVPSIASAHPTRSFDSCAAYRRHGGYCGDTASYVFGDRVFLRGRVSPSHTRFEAHVVFLRPGAAEWRRGVSLPISDTGRMRWSFRSEEGDADQTEPWRFRFRIPGHGVSDVAEVYILLGE
jgi:hypothetical protein